MRTTKPFPWRHVGTVATSVAIHIHLHPLSSNVACLISMLHTFCVSKAKWILAIMFSTQMCRTFLCDWAHFCLSLSLPLRWIFFSSFSKQARFEHYCLKRKVISSTVQIVIAHFKMCTGCHLWPHRNAPCINVIQLSCCVYSMNGWNWNEEPHNKTLPFALFWMENINNIHASERSRGYMHGRHWTIARTTITIIILILLLSLMIHAI